MYKLYSLLYQNLRSELIKVMVYRIFRIIFNIYARVSKIKVSDNVSSLNVYLTSYEDRLPGLRYVIVSLICQTVRPKSITLVLTKEDFNKLPNEVLILSDRFSFFKIKISHDYRSHKKYFHAVSENNYPFLTVDDDTMYPNNLIENFENIIVYDDKTIYCNHAHIISNSDIHIDSYVNFDSPYQNNSKGCYLPIGVCGIVYQKYSLSKDVITEDFMTICPTADDIWLRAKSLQIFTKVVLARQEYLPYPQVICFGNKSSSLVALNVTQGGNDRQLDNLSKMYDWFEERVVNWKEDKKSSI